MAPLPNSQYPGSLSDMQDQEDAFMDTLVRILTSLVIVLIVLAIGLYVFVWFKQRNAPSATSPSSLEEIRTRNHDELETLKRGELNATETLSVLTTIPSSALIQLLPKCKEIEKTDNDSEEVDKVEVGEEEKSLEEGCVICLEQDISRDERVLLPCQHLLHSQCLEHWWLHRDAQYSQPATAAITGVQLQNALTVSNAPCPICKQDVRAALILSWVKQHK